MIEISVLLLAFAGFAGLCAAMNKHQLALLGQRLSPPQSGILRAVAAASLATALALAIADQGPGFGSVYWTGAIMIAALALTLVIPYRPQWARPAGLAAAGAGVMLLCAHLLLLWSGA